MVSPQALVQAGLYPDEESVIQEALRVLWQERPQLRIDWAVYRYQTDDISLAKAAALAGVCFDRMKEISDRSLKLAEIGKPKSNMELQGLLGLAAFGLGILAGR